MTVTAILQKDIRLSALRGERGVVVRAERIRENMLAEADRTIRTLPDQEDGEGFMEMAGKARDWLRTVDDPEFFLHSAFLPFLRKDGGRCIVSLATPAPAVQPVAPVRPVRREEAPGASADPVLKWVGVSREWKALRGSTVAGIGVIGDIAVGDAAVLFPFGGGKLSHEYSVARASAVASRPGRDTHLFLLRGAAVETLSLGVGFAGSVAGIPVSSGVLVKFSLHEAETMWGMSFDGA